MTAESLVGGRALTAERAATLYARGRCWVAGNVEGPGTGLHQAALGQEGSVTGAVAEHGPAECCSASGTAAGASDLQR